MQNNTLNLAKQTNLPQLVMNTGVKLVYRAGRYTGLCPFHQEKTPSFTLSMNNGIWRYHCYGCGAHGDAINFVMDHERCEFGAAIKKLNGDYIPRTVDPRPVIQEQEKRAQHVQRYTNSLWASARDLQNSLVIPYLRARGLHVPHIIGAIQGKIKFLPAHAHKETGRVFPVMLSAICDHENKMVGLHRTYLASDGRGKAPVRNAKMMLGRAWGGCVSFGPQGNHVYIAEGIETALSIYQAMRKENPCVLAALSRNNMGALKIPSYVHKVILCGDADNKDTATNAKILREAAQKYRERGFDVKIAMPPAGMDFNDLLVRAL